MSNRSICYVLSLGFSARMILHSNLVCQLKKAGFKSYMVAMFTVLAKDLSEDKWYKLLYPCKIKTAKIIKNHLEEHEVANGNLQYWQFRVSRAEQTSPRTGDILTPERLWEKEDIEAILPDGVDIKPFNYKDVCKPKSHDLLQRLLEDGTIEKPKPYGQSTTGSSSYNNEEDDEPPF